MILRDKRNFIIKFIKSFKIIRKLIHIHQVDFIHFVLLKQFQNLIFQAHERDPNILSHTASVYLNQTFASHPFWESIFDKHHFMLILLKPLNFQDFEMFMKQKFFFFLFGVRYRISQ